MRSAVRPQSGGALPGRARDFVLPRSEADGLGGWWIATEVDVLLETRIWRLREKRAVEPFVSGVVTVA